MSLSRSSGIRIKDCLPCDRYYDSILSPSQYDNSSYGKITFHTASVRKSIYTPAHRQLLQLLRQIRNEADLTQGELGLRVDADQSEVSHWETGEKRLDLLEICQIVDAVGLPLREFIERFEKMSGRSD